MSTYAFTCGDVNGIGPEIVVKTLNTLKTSSKRKIIFICPANIFENTIKIVSPKFNFDIIKSIPEQHLSSKILILDIGKSDQSYGKTTASSGRTSYNSIINACELAGKRLADGIITAPISKHAFVKANIGFPGHTELLANYFKVSNFSMMFVSNKMKAGLVTIHIPIKSVPKNITKKKLLSTINIIQESLQRDFKIDSPKIAVLGLNPHSGENGNIGNEEELLIKPIIKEFSKNISGPFIPDAYFGTREYEKYDCTIGMYHDQVLIPFKLLNSNHGVNYTAGLPIVRTSPDHGTAFDIAGKGIANNGSMIQAFNYAVKIVNNRKA